MTRKWKNRNDDGTTSKQRPKRTKTSEKWYHSLRNRLCNIRIFHRAQRGENRTRKWLNTRDAGATLKQQPKRTKTSGKWCKSLRSSLCTIRIFHRAQRGGNRT